jgi:uncharacterized membrane protein YhaH (DUF805 family)
MLINLILILVFFLLSKYLKPATAFYFSVLFLMALYLMVINVIIICIAAIITARRKIDLRGIIVLLISVLLCTGFIFVSFKSSLTDMIKDIPYAMSSNYSVTEGICNDTYTVKSQFYFEVNKIYFRMDESAMKYILNGKKYRVVYLPNSKTVIDVNSIP